MRETTFGVVLVHFVFGQISLLLLRLTSRPAFNLCFKIVLFRFFLLQIL